MLNFLIGFGVAILSGLGIGGGGLLVIYLALFSGVGQLEAQGINLIFFLFSSGAAMIVHLIRRRLNLRLIAYLALCGCVGAIGGSLIAQAVPAEMVRYAFGALLVVSGLMALR
ncbi:MAG: TSUP family transporter [Clostridiales bacterium]|nr:TSUP family transporter [Clostridiales bacterium]